MHRIANPISRVRLSVAPPAVQKASQRCEAFLLVLRWCPGRDLNPHASRLRLLRPLRLPIPPPGRVCPDHSCAQLSCSWLPMQIFRIRPTARQRVEERTNLHVSLASLDQSSGTSNAHSPCNYCSGSSGCCDSLGQLCRRLFEGGSSRRSSRTRGRPSRCHRRCCGVRRRASSRKESGQEGSCAATATAADALSGAIPAANAS